MSAATGAVGGRRPARLLTQLASTFGVEAIGFLAAIGFSVVVTRLLGPAGKGAFAAAMSAVSIAVAISGAGLAKSLLHYAGRRPDQAKEYGRAAFQILPVMVLGSGITMAVFFIGETQVDWPTWAIGTAVAAATVCGGLLESMRRARREILRANLANMTQTVGQLALVGVAFFVFTLDFRIVLACVAGAWAMRCVVLATKDGPWQGLRAKLDGPRLKELLAYGMTYQAYAVLWVLHTRLVIVLVERWASLDSAGFYSTGANLAQLLWRLPIIVSFVTIPVMTAAKGSKEAAELTALSCRLLLPIAAAAATTFYLFSDPIVAFLYEARFLPSAEVLRILLPGSVASVVYLVLVGHLLARKRLGALVAVGAVGAIANLTLCAAWIPSAGANGAAVASCLSYTLSCLIALAVVVRGEDVPLPRYLLLQRSDLDLILRRIRGA